MKRSLLFPAFALASVIPADAALTVPPVSYSYPDTGAYTATHSGAPQSTPPTPAYPTGSPATYQSNPPAPSATGIPEPGTALFGLGLLAAVAVRRRR